MDWHKRFKSKGCSLKLSARDKETALAEVVDNLVKGEVLDAALAEDAKAALLAREEMASTGVGMNVAIPHVRLDGLEEAACSLSVCADGHRMGRRRRRAGADPLHRASPFGGDGPPRP